MKKPKIVLCKRTQTGIFNNDNNVLTKGKWYNVVYNENDRDYTFTIIDDKNHLNLFIMYEDENNQNLPRTYSKWFYTKRELRKFKLNKLNKIKNIND